MAKQKFAYEIKDDASGELFDIESETELNDNDLNAILSDLSGGGHGGNVTQGPKNVNRTKLGPEQEHNFKAWYSKIAQETGLDPDPDNANHKYDYRGAFVAGDYPKIDPADGQYHWSSKFKDDDHPNRFVDGADTKNDSDNKTIYADPVPKGVTEGQKNKRGTLFSQVFEMPPVDIADSRLPSTKGTIKEERAAVADVNRRKYAEIERQQARPISEEDPQITAKRDFLREFAETRGANLPFMNPIDMLGYRALESIGPSLHKAVTSDNVIDAGINLAHGAFSAMMATPAAQPFNVAFEVGNILLPETTQALMQPANYTADQIIRYTFESETGRQPTDKEFEDIKRNVNNLKSPRLGMITGKQALEIGDIVGNFILFHQFHKGTRAATDILESRQRKAFNAEKIKQQQERDAKSKLKMDEEFKSYYSKIEDMRSGVVNPESLLPTFLPKTQEVPLSPILDAQGKPIPSEQVRSAIPSASTTSKKKTLVREYDEEGNFTGRMIESSQESRIPQIDEFHSGRFIGNPNERFIASPLESTQKREILDRNYENDAMISRKIAQRESLTLEEQIYADRYNIESQKMLQAVSDIPLPGKRVNAGGAETFEGMIIESGEGGLSKALRGKERTTRRPQENLTQVMDRRGQQRIFYPSGRINVNRLAELLLQAEKEGRFDDAVKKLQNEAERLRISDAFVTAMQNAGEINFGKVIPKKRPGGIPEQGLQRESEPILYNINNQRFNEIQKKLDTGKPLNAKDIIERQKFEERGIKFKETNKLSSTQVNIPESEAKPFVDFAKSIPDEEVYLPETEGKPNGFGREIEPHVTALFGLKDQSPEKVQKLLNNFGDVEIELGKTSIFKQKDYDVLKVNVKSESLREINKILRDNLEYESDFPDYKPHLTIAYLKPGQGKKYASDARFEGKKIKFSELLFSDPNRQRISIPLGVKTKPSTQAKSPTQQKPSPVEDISKLSKGELLSRVVREKDPAKESKIRGELERREGIRYTENAKELGITFDGMQRQAGKESLPQFTDPKTGTTFYKGENETLAEALKRKRDQFEKSNEKPKKTELSDEESKTIEAKVSERMKIVDVPIETIKKDVDAFQNRGSEFSQESVDKIKNAVKEGRFNWAEFDPILLWKEPKTGDIFVLSGHSRSEAFAQLSKEGNAEFSNIPAKIIEGVTKEQAREIAKRSNVLGTRETPLERANYYGEERLKGRDQKDIIAEARQYEGKNAQRIIALSFLNSKGKAVEQIRAMQDADSQSQNNAYTMGEWTGEIRRRFPDLTNSHENELYDFLIDTFGKRGARTKTEFLERVNSVIQKRTGETGEFDSTKPLNIANIVSKSSAEVQYDSRITEAERVLADAEKRRDAKEKDLIQKNAKPDEVERIMSIYNSDVTNARRELMNLKQSREGEMQKLRQSEMSLFDNLEEVSDEAKRRIEERTEDQIEKSEASIKALERQEESAAKVGDVERVIEATEQKLAEITGTDNWESLRKGDIPIEIKEKITEEKIKLSEELLPLQEQLRTLKRQLEFVESKQTPKSMQARSGILREMNSIEPIVERLSSRIRDIDDQLFGNQAAIFTGERKAVEEPQYAKQLRNTILRSFGEDPNLYRLAGDKNARNRVVILSMIEGKTVPKAKAGLEKVIDAIYRVAKVDRSLSETEQRRQFTSWLTEKPIETKKELTPAERYAESAAKAEAKTFETLTEKMLEREFENYKLDDTAELKNYRGKLADYERNLTQYRMKAAEQDMGSDIGLVREMIDSMKQVLKYVDEKQETIVPSEKAIAQVDEAIERFKSSVESKDELDAKIGTYIQSKYNRIAELKDMPIRSIPAEQNQKAEIALNKELIKYAKERREKLKSAEQQYISQKAKAGDNTLLEQSQKKILSQRAADLRAEKEAELSALIGRQSQLRREIGSGLGKPEQIAKAKSELGDVNEQIGKLKESLDMTGEADMFGAKNEDLFAQPEKPKTEEKPLSEDEVYSKAKVINKKIEDALIDHREGKLTDDQYLDLARELKKEKADLFERFESRKPSEVNLNNKQVGTIFDRLEKGEVETEEYGFEGLLNDWGGVEYNRESGKLIFTETRGTGGKYSMTKKGFIEWLTSEDATKMSADAEYQSTLKKVRDIIAEEMAKKPSTEKQPWEMTRDEYRKSNRKGSEVLSLSVGRKHQESVEQALSEGKPVPESVLKDYPDLKAKSGEGKPVTFDTYKDIRIKLKKNEFDAKGLKENFQYYVDNKEAITKAIRDWLDTDPNYKRKRPSTKDEIAKKSYEDTLDAFAYAGHESISYVMDFGKDFQQKKFDQLKKQVESTTDEMIEAQRKRAEERQKSFEEYKGRVKQAVENPQTLEDFNLRKQYKAPELKPEQQDRYEDLYSIDSKKKRIEDSIVDVTSVGEHTIKQDKDTRDNSDLWVVTPKTRLSSEAFSDYAKAMRQLGGYWSRFKGGFLFKEDPSPKLGGTEKVEFKQKIHSDRLRETADNMQDAIDNKLDVSGTRKTNTYRRANMAEGQIADGERLQRIQTIMRNIADGLDGGDIALLDKLSARTEIEQFEDIIRSARHRYARKISEGSKEYKAFDTAYEKPVTKETIRYAEMPKVTLHKDTARKLIESFGASSITGKKIAKLLKALPAEEWTVDITDFYRSVMNKIDEKGFDDYLRKQIEEDAKDVRRLEKLGIESTEELRAYLREYLPFREEIKFNSEKDILRKKERELLGAKIEGYFPTPKTLVERMLEEADIQDNMKVLEPSAGKGNIADMIRDEYPTADLSVVEQYSTLRDILELKKHKLAGNDFLKYNEKQDRIVMNPPFENLQDIDHVRHAYDLLNPGGKLVSIMSESPFFRSDKKAQEFRDWMEVVNGTSEKNPEGSFKTSERPTGVATRLVVIEKPAESIAEQAQKTPPQPEGESLKAFTLPALAIGSNAAIDQLPVDDERKKELKALLAAGILGVGMVYAPKWFLKSKLALNQAKQSIFNTAQARALFKDVKAEELKWTGLEDYLRSKEAKGEKITREELQRVVDEGRIEIEEIERGENKNRVQNALAKIEELEYRKEQVIEKANPYTRKGEDAPQNLIDEVVELQDRIEDLRQSIRVANDTKYYQYQLPGGEYYRELLMTMPSKQRSVKDMSFKDWYEEEVKGGRYSTDYDALSESAKTLLRDQYGKDKKNDITYSTDNFVSNHFDEPNILAHVRFNDRVVDGKKVLFMEEAQSDWHQKGRKEGYSNKDGYSIADKAFQENRDALKNKYGDDWFKKMDREETTVDMDLIRARDKADKERMSNVPDAPFKKDWHEVTFRRMVRYAAENGYDGISWTTGLQQAERYDLSKQVQSIKWGVDKDGTYALSATPINAEGDVFFGADRKRYTAEELPDIVGKEVAQNIVDQSKLKKTGELTGLDLKVGTKGMEGFYDKILVDYANKFGKKFGAKVESANIPIPEKETSLTGEEGYSESFFAKEPVHYLPVTEQMRKTALSEGFPLFSLGANLAAHAAVNASDMDDDTKKKVIAILNGLTMAGIGGTVLMSKDAQRLLAEIRSSVARKALSEKWSSDRIIEETKKAVHNFSLSDEAKAFSPKDIEAMRQANSSPATSTEAVKVSSIAKTVETEPRDLPPEVKALPQSGKIAAVMENPALLQNKRTVESTTETLSSTASEFFEDIGSIAKDEYSKSPQTLKNGIRKLVRATTVAATDPKFKKVYDTVGDAERASNRRIYDIEEGIRDARNGLSDASQEKIAKLRYEENKMEGIYTDAELAKRGFTKEEITSINKLRKVQSDVLDISRDLRLKEWNDYLFELESDAQAERWRLNEEKPSKKLILLEKQVADTKNRIREVENYFQSLKDQGYLTLKRRGRYVVVAEDLSKPEGTVERIQYDHAIDRLGQQEVRRRFQEAGFKNIRLYEINKFFNDFKEKLSPTQLEMLIDGAGVRWTPEVEKLVNEVKKRFATKSYELERRYVPGYKENMKNLVAGLISQGEAFNNLYFKKIGKEQSMKALRESDIESKDPDLFAFTRNYVEASYSTAEVGTFNRLQHIGKKITYIMQLGLDPMQFVFNGILQPLMVTRPYFARKEFGLSSSEVNRNFKDAIPLARDLIKHEAETEIQGIYDRLVKEGVATEILSKELADIEAKQAGVLPVLSHKMSIFTRKGEQYTRAHTIAEAFMIGKELKKSGNDLYRFVVDAVNITQGKAGRGEMPELFRGKANNELGRTAYQFFSYVNLYLENIAMSFKDDIASKRISMPAARKILGTLAVVGGINAFPGSGLAQLLYVKITGRDPKDDLKKYLGQIGSDLVMYGITTSPGFSGRIGILNRTPQSNEDYTSIEQWIPAARQAGDIVRGIQNIAEGDLFRAAQKLLPRGVRNLAKTLEQSQRGVTVKEGGKNKVLKSKRKLNAIDYSRTAIGIAPPDATEYYRKKNLGLKKSSLRNTLLD